MRIPKILLPGLLLLWSSSSAVQAAPLLEPLTLDETELRDYGTSASLLDESANS